MSPYEKVLLVAAGILIVGLYVLGHSAGWNL